MHKIQFKHQQPSNGSFNDCAHTAIFHLIIIDSSLDSIWLRKFQFQFNHSTPAVIFELCTEIRRRQERRRRRQCWRWQRQCKFIQNTCVQRIQFNFSFVQPVCVSVFCSFTVLLQMVGEKWIWFKKWNIIDCAWEMWLVEIQIQYDNSILIKKNYSTVFTPMMNLLNIHAVTVVGTPCLFDLFIYLFISCVFGSFRLS